MLDGNGAAAEALKLARVGVISAYPITPQSPISEILAEFVEKGELKAKYIRVESEHSAMSAAIGAQFTGVRAATATASVGLALMHEVVGVASGCRVPIVMPVVNRALVSPWSLWCDHQDAMAERDSGWLQFYTESVQEVLDMTIIAYKVAEDENVLLPAMVCLDGFFLSHSMQRVDVPAQAFVDEFIGAYQNKNLFLSPEDPMFINDLTSPDDFSEIRYQQKAAFDQTLKVIPRVFKEFYEQTGREYRIVEPYKCEDAEAVLVTLGSMSGTAKHVTDKLRQEGKKVGVLRIAVFRPFPAEEIKAALKGKKMIGIFDRSAGLGSKYGPVCNEVMAVINDQEVKTYNFIAGLGGRDITAETIEKAFLEMLSGQEETEQKWIDTKKNAMEIRQVSTNV